MFLKHEYERKNRKPVPELSSQTAAYLIPISIELTHLKLKCCQTKKHSSQYLLGILPCHLSDKDCLHFSYLEVQYSLAATTGRVQNGMYFYFLLRNQNLLFFSNTIVHICGCFGH